MHVQFPTKPCTVACWDDVAAEANPALDASAQIAIAVMAEQRSQRIIVNPPRAAAVRYAMHALPWLGALASNGVPWAFWTNYLIALATVAIILCGLYALARRFARGRGLAATNRGMIAVLESTMLAPHASVHVVRVGRRYLLIGAGGATLSTLADVAPGDDVEAS
jgi:flagellar biogenesis protein FliO